MTNLRYMMGALALVTTGLVAAADAPLAQERAYLGVQLLAGPNCNVEVAGNANPICVGQVRPGSAAERAGLQAGDVFLRINQTPLSDVTALQSITQAFRAGQLVEIEIQREGKAQTVRVQLEERDRATNPAAAPGLLPPVILPFAQVDLCEATKLVGAPKSPLPGLPFRKLPADMKSEMLTGLLDGKQAAVLLEDDVLTLAVRSNENLVRVVGSIQCALDRVAGTDLWALRLQMANWDQAFLSAQFLAIQGTADPLMPTGLAPTAIVTVVFRGKNSPAAPPSATPLRGSITQATVQSGILGMPRKVSVYLPPGTRGKALPVLYLADGQETAPFAAIAEALIKGGRVAPFAIVGEHAGRYEGDTAKPFDPKLDARGREYLPIMDPPQFEKHMRFFVEELIPWAEKQYGLSAQRNGRAAMGYSNGGAFVEALGLQHPELFASVMPFSPAGPPFHEVLGDPQRYPRFLFAGGYLEPSFMMNASAGAQSLKSKGVATDTRWYLTGHDTLQWQQALADYLPQVFPARAK